MRAEDRGGVPALALATVPSESEAVLGRSPRAAVSREPPDSPPRKVAARGARKEREFLAGFLALEREEPGALAARAADVLADDGPAAEKVALLRALEQCDSLERVRWLEHAVRALPDDSGPHGVSVASFALGELVAAAPVDRDARSALWHLAFETRALGPALRREAAVGFARNGEDRELERLRVALTRESDELLVAGALAALRDRPESPRTAGLLGEFSPVPAGSPPARDE